MSLHVTSDASDGSTAVARATTSVPTITAIALFDYVVANVLHEAAGHGGTCLAVGGRPLGVTSAWLECATNGVSAWGQRLEAAGGTAANLVFGALALVVLRGVSRRSAGTWYAVWLFAAANLFMGGGYLLTSPLFGFGDWGAFLQGLKPLIAWKLGLTAAGAVLSMASLFALLRAIDPMLGTGLAERQRSIRVLTWLPYVVGGLLLSGSAILNPLGPEYVFTSALSTFGGTSFLAWMPAWVKERRTPVARPLDLRADVGWILTGLVAAALCVGVLGHGIRFAHK